MSIQKKKSSQTVNILLLYIKFFHSLHITVQRFFLYMWSINVISIDYNIRGYASWLCTNVCMQCAVCAYCKTITILNGKKEFYIYNTFNIYSNTLLHTPRDCNTILYFENGKSIFHNVSLREPYPISSYGGHNI